MSLSSSACGFRDPQESHSSNATCSTYDLGKFITLSVHVGVQQGARQRVARVHLRQLMTVSLKRLQTVALRYVYTG